jgi:hypothetical protein
MSGTSGLVQRELLLRDGWDRIDEHEDGSLVRECVPALLTPMYILILAPMNHTGRKARNLST